MLSILALACLVFFIGGYHLLYQCRLAEVKAAVKKNLALVQTPALTRLVLSAAEAAALDWEEEAEFCYRGKMYDVLKVEQKAGQTVYWCLADDKETALLEAYAKTQNPSDKDPSQSLTKLLKIPFLPSVFPALKYVRLQEVRPLSFYTAWLLTRNASVLSPPPKV